MTRIYIRNARRTGEEQTLSALYIDTDMLPDGVRVVERARNGCELADGTIARAGELTEWVYVLRDDAIDWVSHFLVPMPIPARWQWNQDRLDAAITRAITEHAACAIKHARDERNRVTEFARAAAIREAAQSAAFAFFEARMIPARKARKLSRIADKDGCGWWVIEKDETTVTLTAITSGPRQDAIAGGERVEIPCDTPVMQLNDGVLAELYAVKKMAQRDAERKFDNEADHA